MKHTLFFNLLKKKYYVVGDVFCDYCNRVIEEVVFVHGAYFKKKKGMINHYCSGCSVKENVIKNVDRTFAFVKPLIAAVIVSSVNNVPKNSIVVTQRAPEFVNSNGFNIFETALSENDKKISYDNVPVQEKYVDEKLHHELMHRQNQQIDVEKQKLLVESRIAELDTKSFDFKKEREFLKLTFSAMPISSEKQLEYEQQKKQVECIKN